MMKKLNAWLTEHAPVWPWEGREGVVHLWAMLITFISFMCIGIFGLDAVLICAILCLGSCIGCPILAGIIALIKKQKWNPWFWFPCVIGVVFGGLFAMLICWVFGIV